MDSAMMAFLISASDLESSAEAVPESANKTERAKPIRNNMAFPPNVSRAVGRRVHLATIVPQEL